MPTSHIDKLARFSTLLHEVQSIANETFDALEALSPNDLSETQDEHVKHGYDQLSNLIAATDELLSSASDENPSLLLAVLATILDKHAT